jgi:hypothetical protein
MKSKKNCLLYGKYGTLSFLIVQSDKTAYCDSSHIIFHLTLSVSGISNGTRVVAQWDSPVWRCKSRQRRRLIGRADSQCGRNQGKKRRPEKQACDHSMCCDVVTVDLLPSAGRVEGLNIRRLLVICCEC